MQASTSDLVVARIERSGPRQRVRLPEDFCLPRGYVQRDRALTSDDEDLRDADGRRVEYWNADRIAASARFQHHVYAWAADLVRDRGLKTVLDLGCGPGTKTTRLIAPLGCETFGWDQPSAIAAAKRAGFPGALQAVDLERCEEVRPERTFDLIICADVLEHLLDPDPAIGLIRRCCHAGSLVLLSTPDRARLRGRACMTCAKPEHVREWSTPEFLAYVGSRGMRVLRRRLMPADDAPPRTGAMQDFMWRMRLAVTSPRRCLAVACRPGGDT